ncbi:MAG: T9SS type A sorting domain-containing protein [Bacteroidota bacterium]
MNTFRLFAFSILLSLPLSAQGTVYLVLGSDTGIWEGLDVSKYYCTYNLGLYDDPARNTYAVMDPAFRDQFKDSYGTTMKMTWWMMAGNVYRFATNTNVPVPNTMTLYLMKKYHGTNVARFGDELSLHYHTFTWTDYNNDGQFFWNQAKNFNECKEDFEVTLADFLLEENTVPVSFRSGWHYMDNEWQNYIDPLIPYSLHNDYPAKRSSIVEPIDNVFDWSKASKEFVPYRVSLTDYQLPGKGKSWNVRSQYMAHLTAADMDSLFAKAGRGTDQVASLWAHLPEADFAYNMKRLDSLAHISAKKFPNVPFRYSTGTEAMQRWRGSKDTIPPTITLTEKVTGEQVTFEVTSNEDIFQNEPLIAVKDMNERSVLLHSTKTSAHSWTTISPLLRSSIVKVGAALTDTMGNLSTVFKNYLPDDIYIDNKESGYQELRGSWTTSSIRSWGTDSRQAVLTATDSAVIEWTPSIKQSGKYNIFLQIPKLTNPADTLRFTISSNGMVVNSLIMTAPFTENKWRYITTAEFSSAAAAVIRMTADGKNQAGKTVCADVLKLSGIVHQRKIQTPQSTINPVPISEEDSVTVQFSVQNQGIGDLTITSVSSKKNLAGVSLTLPLVIPGMQSSPIPLVFYSSKSGLFNDTLTIISNDPLTPELRVPITITVQPYFKVIDNEDGQYYSESGPWAKSVAQVWGNSSRYAPSGTGASAFFTVPLKKNGTYEILEIVPKTVNSVTKALYTIRNGADTAGTVTLDQNLGSGGWVSLGKFSLSSSAAVTVKVQDKGAESNFVLRADAIKVQIQTPLSVERSPIEAVNDFVLEQNFPNPFNPSTTIRFGLPQRSRVVLTVYDMLGRTVRTLVREEMESGMHSLQFDGTGLSSGMYVYAITAGSFSRSKVMVLVK